MVIVTSVGSLQREGRSAGGVAGAVHFSYYQAFQLQFVVVATI